MGRRPLGDLNPNNYNRALDIRGPAQISNIRASLGPCDRFALRPGPSGGRYLGRCWSPTRAVTRAKFARDADPVPYLSWGSASTSTHGRYPLSASRLCYRRQTTMCVRARRTNDAPRTSTPHHGRTFAALPSGSRRPAEGNVRGGASRSSDPTWPARPSPIPAPPVSLWRRSIAAAVVADPWFSTAHPPGSRRGWA
jgi:hypothetical protein